MGRSILLSLMSVMWAAPAPAQVVINEILAVNQRTNRDQDGDSSDWVEIFNRGRYPIDLEGYGLSDDSKNPRKWLFPSVILSPGAYLLVWCSGKKTEPPTQYSKKTSGAPGESPFALERAAPVELHTNFRLNSKGETVLLTKPDGRILEQVTYWGLTTDISWGRSKGWFRYHKRPTPMAKNGGPTTSEPLIVDDISFSSTRGFYDSPIQVALTTNTRKAQIRYTTDGSEPNLRNGRTYKRPIDIDGTTLLRAAGFKPGHIPTKSVTHTYFFLSDIARQTHRSTVRAGFPSHWGRTPADYGLDPIIVGRKARYRKKYRRALRESLSALPSLSLVTNLEDLFGEKGLYTNCNARGLAWERPVSAELIHPDGTKGFQINATIRAHGGVFRSHKLTKKHSLRLLFNGVYGPKKLKYPLFGKTASQRFDTLALKACSNDGWQWEHARAQPLYVRDTFSHQTMLDMGGIAPHERPVHLYLNGAYWGLYYLTERPDASFAATYLGGKKKDWDIVRDKATSKPNLRAWNHMQALSAAGLADDAAYQAIQGHRPDGTEDPNLESYVNFDSLVDYIIVNLYVGNKDWPERNFWAGRNKKNPTGFHFFLWDSEWSLGLRTSTVEANVVDVGALPAAPYAAARANPEFRLFFADRVHRHFFNGGALSVDSGRNVPAERFQRLTMDIEEALIAESARWGDQHETTPYTRDEHWRTERDRLLRKYFPRRSAVLLEQLVGAGLYPRVSAPSFNQHGGRVPKDFAVFLSAPAGTVYFTTDGTDPRVRGGAVNQSAYTMGSGGGSTPLQNERIHTRLTRGMPVSLGWTATDFDHSVWQTETKPPNYRALNDGLYSLLVRIPFIVKDGVGPGELKVRIKYNDGYAIYLNGRRIAARTPERSEDQEETEGSVLFQRFSVPLDRDLLRSGENVLAVHDFGARLAEDEHNGENGHARPILPQFRVSGVSLLIARSMTVKARVRAGNVWSALTEASFVVEKALSKL